jgi:hypothetical protein
MIQRIPEFNTQKTMQNCLFNNYPGYRYFKILTYVTICSVFNISLDTVLIKYPFFIIPSMNRLRLNVRIIILGFVIGSSFTSVTKGQAVLGARDVSMGGAVTALHNDQWAVFENPAMLSDSNRSISFYTMRYYGLKELTDYAVNMTFPTKIGVVGAGGHTYGSRLYRKSRFRLALMEKIQGIRLGISLNYTDINLATPYGSSGALGLNLGLGAQLIEGLWLGAKAMNINDPHYQNDPVPLPRSLSAGISYNLANNVLITSEVYKDVDFPVSFRGGLEIKVMRFLQMRAGVTTEPVTFALGVGIHNRKWNVNFVTQNHQVLGWSPGIDFSCLW